MREGEAGTVYFESVAGVRALLILISRRFGIDILVQQGRTTAPYQIVLERYRS